MTLREKKCKYCNTYFQYEDGIDSHGVSVGRQDSLISVAENERRAAFCPQCHDPHKIRGMSYLKTTILLVLRRHLKKHGVQVEYLDFPILEGMLKEFPKSAELYSSNGSYRTFTLLPGLEFQGKYGNFRLGECYPYTTYVKNTKRPHTQIKDLREVICVRCSFGTKMNTLKALTFYLGIEQKLCKRCDSWQYMHNANAGKGKPQQLPKPKKSEYSDLTLARALNVSRNDFMRHEITKPEPPLPLNTIVNGMQIIEAFWCEATYTPKYVLLCPKCNQTFTTLQKRVYQLQHFC